MFWLTCLLLSALSLEMPAGEDGNSNFLLVTIDTWRADYISASGSGKVRTPFLDKLAGEGRYLKRVDTPCVFTTPTHASILTGMYPARHGVRDNTHFMLDQRFPTMAELFRQAGYSTVAVVSAAPLKSRYGLGRGFDIYDDEGLGAKGIEQDLPVTERIGAKSSERALKLAASAGSKPLFIWVHLYDPHYPYAPPDEFRRSYPADRYAGEVAYADDVLKKLVEGLLSAKKGRWTVLVTSDHGEGLGEKDEQTHGLLLYRQTREVPLILWDSEKRPDGFGPGEKSLVDVFQTVVDMFSLTGPPNDGISLFRDTRGGRWLFSESMYPAMSYGLNPSLLARRDDRVFIRHGTSVEVYVGGNEEKDLKGSMAAFAAEAEGEINRFFGVTAGTTRGNLALSGEEVKALESLGYIGSSKIPGRLTSCDLRVFSKDFSGFFSRGQEEIRKGNPMAALGYYDAIIGKYPGAPLLRFEKGALLVRMQRFEEARKEFVACLDLDPGNCEAMLNLGTIMKMERKPREAERFYLSSLRCDEEQAQLHMNLGTLYLEDLRDRDLAIKHFKRFLELAPAYSKKEELRDLIRALTELKPNTQAR